MNSSDFKIGKKYVYDGNWSEVYEVTDLHNNRIYYKRISFTVKSMRLSAPTENLDWVPNNCIFARDSILYSSYLINNQFNKFLASEI